MTIQLGENTTDTSTYECDLVSLIVYVHRRAPKAQIILIGDFWNKGKNQLRKQAAEDVGIPFANLEPIIGDKEYQSKEGTGCILVDGTTREVTKAEETHPSDAGMEYIAAKVIENIE